MNGFKFCTDIHWTQRMNRRDLANLLIYVTSRSNLSFTLQNIPLCIRWISAQHAIQIFMSPWGRIVTPLIPPPSVHPAPQSGYNINLSVKSFSFLHPAFSPFILIFIYFYTFSLPQPCVEPRFISTFSLTRSERKEILQKANSEIVDQENRASSKITAHEHDSTRHGMNTMRWHWPTAGGQSQHMCSLYVYTISFVYIWLKNALSRSSIAERINQV